MNIREDIKEKGENIFSEDNFGEQKRLQAHVDFQTWKDIWRHFFILGDSFAVKFV